jgi:hypothetical protein
MTITELITTATRQATATNPRAKQGEINITAARNFAKAILTLLAKLPAAEAGAILARYAKR